MEINVLTLDLEGVISPFVSNGFILRPDGEQRSQCVLEKNETFALAPISDVFEMSKALISLC